ncbi:MAG: tetratricopeptide repeat protein [Spirochaetes bacterium]|nr:tetratricopeptide repeat protein [Spirochaetota bacterium]
MTESIRNYFLPYFPLVVAILVSCSSDSKVRFDNSRMVSMKIEARRHYNEGLKYGKEGKGDMAIDAYTKSIDIDPAVGAYTKRGAEYLRKGRYDLALTDANSAIELNAKYAAAHFLRGNALYRMLKFRSAVKSYLRAIQLDPSRAEFYYNCGQANYRLDRPDDAAAMYEKALAADRSFYPAHYNLACLHARKNDTRKAFESLEKAVAAGFSDVELLKVDASFERMRPDARFNRLIEKIKKNARH